MLDEDDIAAIEEEADEEHLRKQIINGECVGLWEIADQLYDDGVAMADIPTHDIYDRPMTLTGVEAIRRHLDNGCDELGIQPYDRYAEFISTEDSTKLIEWVQAHRTNLPVVVDPSYETPTTTNPDPVPQA